MNFMFGRLTALPQSIAMKGHRLKIILALLCSGSLLSLTKEKRLEDVGSIPRLLCNTENAHYVQIMFDFNHSASTADQIIQTLCSNCPSFLPIQIFGFQSLIEKSNRNNCDSKRTVTIFILKNQNFTENQIYLNAVVRKNDEEKDYRKYVVILEEAREISPDWIEQILRYFWKQNIVNVIVASGLDSTSIFTFIPFTSNGWQVQEIFIADLLPNGAFFPKLTNLYGWEITVVASDMNMKKGYQRFDNNLGMLLEERYIIFRLCPRRQKFTRTKNHKSKSSSFSQR